MVEVRVRVNHVGGRGRFRRLVAEGREWWINPVWWPVVVDVYRVVRGWEMGRGRSRGDAATIARLRVGVLLRCGEQQAKRAVADLVSEARSAGFTMVDLAAIERTLMHGIG